MCQDEFCTDKKHCYRYTATPYKNHQSWSSSFQNKEKKPREKCNHFMKNTNKAKPEVLQRVGLSMQVCVPNDWNYQHVIDFAEQKIPCDTKKGWTIKKQDEKETSQKCLLNNGFIHINLKS